MNLSPLIEIVYIVSLLIMTITNVAIYLKLIKKNKEMKEREALDKGFDKMVRKWKNDTWTRINDTPKPNEK